MSSATSAVSRRGSLPKYQQDPFGTSSPPASAYFSAFPGAPDQELLVASPGADAHFAYSTTLRRYPAESALDVVSEKTSSLWNRVVSVVTGKQQVFKYDEDARRDDDTQRGESTSTASAKFAHCTVEETLSVFRTSVETGLSSSEMARLRTIHGYNEFSVSSPDPLILKFIKSIYENPLILLLCGSAIISAAMGNVDDAISITVAVLIVLTVGFVQERKSEQSLEALNKLVPHHCRVFRDGQEHHLLANELVPSDIVNFQTGDRIPADIRIISAADLEIDESSLTGETISRAKSVEPCKSDGKGMVALADRACIAFMGTLVRNGRGSGIVVATGSSTEFGVVFEMMQEVEQKRTPLQLSMDDLAKKLSIMSFAIIGAIVLIGVLQKRSWLDMFTIGVSLAVAAIPEGLPIVTTVTLALGVLRMAKRKAIVKQLHCVEALGSVSVICSDKTGTLTKNEQTVKELYTVDETAHIDPSGVASHPHFTSMASKKAVEIGALCNNASISKNQDGQYIGQSTDVALLNILEVLGIPDPRPIFTRTTERPFNSENKYMSVSGIHMSPTSTLGTTFNDSPREYYYIKGAIDTVLARCKFYYISEDSTPGLDAATRNVILTKALSTAARGLRVIAMAYSYSSVNPSKLQPNAAQSSTSASTLEMSSQAKDNEKSNLIFVGFQAMFDPPRSGVADSIGLLQSGGVQVVMITGDAEETALSIAKDLGLRVPRGLARSAYCVTGKAIDQMSPAELRDRVGTVSIFARTTPRHKMAIVEAFQARGAVVAMTGDGVNDAPALKMADIGISMGKGGTDVAKEAADMILVDDNFSTILPAVEEGKSIFHNIQNFLSFQLSTAAAALTLITLSTVFGLSNPLNAMQILFINILMDGPPSQSLGVDPVDPVIMRKPPKKKNEFIITRPLLFRVLFSASIIVAGTLLVYIFALSDDHMSRREQTMTFTCFVFLDLVSAIQNRGLRCGLMQNKMLVTTVSISFLVQLALVYVPLMQTVFQTEALGVRDLLTLLGLAAASVLLHQGRREYERSRDTSATYSSVTEQLT